MCVANAEQGGCHVAIGGVLFNEALYVGVREKERYHYGDFCLVMKDGLL